ncbi:hypothetical protein RFI_02445 [Reticulomyxa filosa]|uniref:Uncharacterized protein n=1 Tax=Reticulomyxa filosa TaxID=46433 RepID=X6P952_RETFI|nr:hypothetical protein RFI_02445 [Reticulomyxa filosa]|eukprot:ETO34643.1 hypothetical protein RFI_02445 [Reticulomyxa filosa]
MLENKKWKEYKIAFDYEYRRIILFDEEAKKLQALKIGKHKKQSLEFNVHIQWDNDFSDNLKWCNLTLNHKWKFCTFDNDDREELSNCCAEFNSFNVVWKDMLMQTCKEPLDPYSITLKEALQHLKDKLQMQEHFLTRRDEPIWFKCEYNKCKPPIPSNFSNENVLLHDIYKNLPYYPHIQKKKKRANSNAENYSSDESKFNPFLYARDIHKLKLIQENLVPKVVLSTNTLKNLLHEVIKNGYLRDLLDQENANNKKIHKKIKQQIYYNKNNPDELILNDLILTILNELKILYHDDIHKQMGYPLQLHHICAILLYCGKSCNAMFSYDQIQFRHYKWPNLDNSLCDAIHILHKHEKREEWSIELYCGLKGVRLENIDKEIKSGYFISHISTSDDIGVAQIYRSDQGCILHFHPSMRRATGIESCDVLWISPFKHESEISHQEKFSWNAKLESEDEKTQMTLLTWTRYDQFIQQTLQISTKWNHCIDLNVIYIAYKYWCEGDANATAKLLEEFNEWMKIEDNINQYKKIEKKFVERRCCNHHVNLFCIFFVKKEILVEQRTSLEEAVIHTVNNGLPFVEKDKRISLQKLNN